MSDTDHKIAGKLLFRERWSLRFTMTWINVLSIFVAGTAAGYYALSVLEANKRSDTWAIMFLELERQGYLLQQTLESMADQIDDARWFDLSFASDGKVISEDSGILNVDSVNDFGVKTVSELGSGPKLAVLEHAGKIFLTVPRRSENEGFVRRFSQIPSSVVTLKAPPPADQGRIYLITRQGKLIYSSDEGLTSANIMKSALVRNFVKHPVSQGQFEFQDETGDDAFGFYSEIKNTNVVIFSEVKKKIAMAVVQDIVVKFIAVLALILVFSAVLIQIPLAKITGPLKELSKIAKMVGSGNFAIPKMQKGLGELATLSVAIYQMTKGLTERDARVSELAKEQVEKVRLEGEIAVAQNIQSNLLPSSHLPAESGLDLAAVYVPAAECAGDWYNHAYNEPLGETVLVVADVSGHGAGSSMFTAILAGLFDRHVNKIGSSFSLEEFTHEANDVIFRLGKGKWHATLLIAKFKRDSNFADLLVAGHPAPILNSGQNKDIQATEGKNRLRLQGSQPIGLSLAFSPLKVSVPFSSGSSLIIYTDGLTEASNSAGKCFSRRRVDALAKTSKHSPQVLIDELMTEWKNFTADQRPLDDVCVVAVKAA